MVNHVMKPFFTQKPEKSVEGKPYSRNTVKANSLRAGQIFFWFPSRKAVFHLFGISIQEGKRTLRSITKRSCETTIEFFRLTKHKDPVSSEDLEVLYGANQLDLDAPESFANLAWFTPFSTSEREAVKTNAR